MFSTEVLSYEESQRPAYDFTVASDLTDYLANLELPYRTVAACEAKAMAMARAALAAGFSASALGIVESYIPNLSARGIGEAYEAGECMYTSSPRVPLFSDRLCPDGVLNDRDVTVSYADSQFTLAPTPKGNRIIVEQAGTGGLPLTPGLFVDMQRWELWDFNARMPFSNHAAITLHTQNANGLSADMVIDPGYARIPLPLDTWRSLQRYNKAVILSTNLACEQPNMRFHTELMTDEQYMCLLSCMQQMECPKLESREQAAQCLSTIPLGQYEEIVAAFFNLQEKHEHLPSPYDSAGLYAPMDYALHLAKKLKLGRLHFPPLTELYDNSKVNDTIMRLAPLMLFEVWLDGTDIETHRAPPYTHSQYTL